MKEVLNTVNPIQTAIRSIFVTFDTGVYSLLKLIYELFFNIATINIIDREMIYTVFSRVQLVIGIFMMFQLVMIVIKGIANPDSATDSKSGGGITVIVRIIVSLSLLALIVPINIPSPKNEYEKQINNNGLLFGTLYSLQYRILANNTMGRLILGDDSSNYTDGSSGSQDLSKFANKFTSTIVRVFYTLNTDEDTGKYVCNDGFDATYYQEDVDPNIIIINATEKCGSEHFILKAISHLIDPLQIFQSGKQYRITMNWLSTVVGIILVVVFFMLTFNVAKRVFKLAALQLIAPIPIISYMDPKGSKDGAFSSWVKLLTSTYIELFVQLGVIYFSFAVINMFIKKFFSVETVTSTVGNAFSGDVVTAPLLIGLTFIVMVIALFIFAKDAPKFLKQALGIKNENKFFDSFGQALGVGAVAAGAASSGVAGAVSSYQKNAGKNKGKQIGSAILGGLSGAAGRGVSAGKEFFNSKDGNYRGIMEGNRKNAAQLYSNAADESTFGGRMLAGLQSNVGLKNAMQKLDDKMKYYNSASEALSRITKAFDGNGDYKFQYHGPEIKDSNNNVILSDGEWKSLKDMNDLCNFYSSDGVASKALDSAKKKAQTARFSQIRKMDRDDIITEINNGTMSTNDLVVYDSGKRIYDVAVKYQDEPEFARFKDSSTGKIRAYNDAGTFTTDVLDSNGNVVIKAGEEFLQFGYAFKHDAGQAGKTADQIKNSDEYARAVANAKRAQEAAKKK